MIKYLLFFMAIAGFANLHAQNLNVGIKLQKTNFMYWENGVSAQYSFANLKPDQLYVGFDYLTSRLGSAMGSNALKQDRITASVGWQFRKEKSFRIATKLNFGYFNVSLEEEIFKDLPNSAVLVAPEVGLSYDFRQLPIIISLGGGYNVDFAKEGESPGTLQPLYYNFSVYYKLFQNSENE